GRRRPLLFRWNDLLLPDVLAQDKQQVLRLVLINEIEIRPATLQMKALHAGIEIKQPDRDARDADNRQSSLVAFTLDEPALLDVDIERIGEDVDRVEADLLGHADAVRGALARLRPGGIDEAEFHGGILPLVGTVITGETRVVHFPVILLDSDSRRPYCC